MKSGIIYKVTNTITGKSYIGQTIRTLKERKRGHFNEKNKDYFHNSLRKHKKSNFTWKIIEKCDNLYDLNLAEEWYIRYFNTLCPNGYNLTTGGKNCKCSEETKRKISLSRMGDKNPMYGKKTSEETKRKLREALSGEKNPMFEQPLTLEQRKHLSEINMGKNNPNYGKTWAKPKKVKEVKNEKLLGEKNGMYGVTGERHKQSKKYKIIYPDGREIVIIGLNNFCRDYEEKHNEKLSVSALTMVAQGKRFGHKGFRCEYI